MINNVRNATKPQDQLEQLITKKEKLERRIHEAKSRVSQADRKKRTQRLIQIGGLAEIAGLGDLDKGILLGALLEIAEKVEKNPLHIPVWKQAGDFILKQREAARTGNRKGSEKMDE